MDNRHILWRSLLTGFIGGVFWCSVTLIASYFKIIDISPKMYLQLILSNKKWLTKWYGTVFTIIIFGVFSIVIAYVYHVLFKKIERLIVGVLFGMGISVVVLFILPHLFNDAPYLLTMSKRSMTASICLFILYGTFIGYSISFDYKQIMMQTEKKVT